MVIPIGHCEEIADNYEDNNDVTYLVDVNNTDKCAKHLHKYFAHSSAKKIGYFVKSTDLPNKAEVIKSLESLEKSCEFCLKHKSREKPHRKVDRIE